MGFVNHSIRKAALNGLYFSGISRLLRPVAAGVGAIIVLHRVKPCHSTRFQPSLPLEVTPEFLEETIGHLTRNAYEFVSMDEARSRLLNRDFRTRFATVTLDDAYRDNMVWAKPIFAKHGVPYTIYVPTTFADGVGNLWWLTLESIVANNDRLEFDDCAISCGSTTDKVRAYDRLKKIMLSQPSPAEEQAFVQRLAERYNYDHHAAARATCMNWDELRQLAADPLATIGAHTVSHVVLSKLPENKVREELMQSRRILERELERDIRHLAYPYGGKNGVGKREFRIAAEVGYWTAVTTRLGVLQSDDGSRLQELPRINIDGRYQRQRYFNVLLSGVAPAIWSAWRGFFPAPRARAPGTASTSPIGGAQETRIYDARH